MTERDLHAEEPDEAFAAMVRSKMLAEGRKWQWLADETGIHVNTLRSQLIERPASLKLRTARRVATAIHISIWGEAA